MDQHSLDCLDFERVRELLSKYAMSGLGRKLAGGVCPVSRFPLVKRWLNQVRELQQLVEERGTPPFGGISDVRELLPKCAPPVQATVEDVARIRDALRGARAVGKHFANLPESCPEFRHLAERVGDFSTIADRVDRVIDARGQVRDDASPKIRRLREDIRASRAAIQNVLDKLLNDAGTRRWLQYPNHTFHGDRLVLPLRAENRGRVPGIIHRTSDSGATVYVEPAEIVELNNRISHLRSEEQEEIGRLLWELAHEIHLNAAEIRRTLDTLGVIDLVVAKVRFSRDYGLRCPEINSEGRLNVRGARHPLLLELARRRSAAGETPHEVVPIDYRLGQDFNLLIITGPNTGGKTVTLKTVGLLNLMVQAGLPIPTDEGAEIAVFSHVMIDVGDEQSMQQSLSTFSGHLTRILDMLRKAGPRVMILIDELGAGTDPDEGAALGRAILDELHRLHCRSIVTTHLGALKGYALTRNGAENACVDFDSETLRPTYHLRIGEPGQSNAIAIAQRLGMSRRMINAAYRGLSRKARALQTALDGARHVKREAEDARRHAEEAAREAGQARSQAEAARAQYEQKQQDFHAWVQRVVHLRPGDAVRVRNFDRDGKIVRMRLEQHRAEVDVGAFAVEVPLGDVLPPQTPAPPPPRAAAPVTPPASRKKPQREHPRPAQSGRHPAKGAGSGARPSSTPAPSSLTTEQAAKLKPLDAIYVLRFHREGRIVRLKPDKQVAIVSVGALEVEVPYGGLALPQRGAGSGKPKRTRNKPSAPPKTDDANPATS